MKTIDITATAIGVGLLLVVSSVINPLARKFIEAQYTAPIMGDVAEIVTTTLVCTVALTVTLILVEHRSVYPKYRKALIFGLFWPIMLVKAVWIVAFTEQQL